MQVRVYDKEKNEYFKSEVYAIINSGIYEKKLVRVNDNQCDYLKFYDDFLKTSDNYEVLINTINHETSSDWIDCKNLEEFDILNVSYFGVKWLLDDIETLKKLIQGEMIPVKGSIFENNLFKKSENGYKYIETQADIDDLMNQTCGFHDTVIKSIQYISGGYVDEHKCMHLINESKVSMTLDSQITSNIELVFEGVIKLNVRPPGDNYSSEIYGASVFVDECIVYFFDDILNKIDTNYNFTWISAYSTKWKFL